MAQRIRIAIEGGATLEAELDDGPAAAQLLAALPLRISMSRWGDEYYGELPVKLAAGGRKRDVYGIGELGLWPPGNAFCIFFGPTPASHGKEPRMASPGIALGRVASGVEALAALGMRIEVTLRP